MQSLNQWSQIRFFEREFLTQIQETQRKFPKGSSKISMKQLLGNTRETFVLMKIS